ncbi:MAG: response regulator [Calditrichaceae bacterium]|nr:response regulator [Calditrichaceae bacterium]
MMKQIFLKTVYTICLFMFTPLMVQAYNYQFDRLSIEDGLSHNSVIEIFQDQTGFLWFGTEDGLNKYDGYNFTVYRFQEGNESSISNNFISIIFEDKRGNLWIGTRNGLNRYNKETDKFIRYMAKPGEKGFLQNNSIESIYQDRQNTIWVGTSRGFLHRYNYETDSFENFQIQANDYTYFSIVDIFEDSRHNLWIGTISAKLFLFDRENQRFIPKFRKILFSYSVKGIKEDKDRLLWVGTNLGLYKINPVTEKHTFYRHDPNNPGSLSNGKITYIYRDQDDRMWIGTGGNGVNIYNPETDSFEHISHEPTNPNSLSHNFIRGIYQDRSGIIWIGTDFGGVNKLNMRAVNFVHFHNWFGELNPLYNNDVRALCEDRKGQIWIGTRGGGVYCYNRKDNSYKHYSNVFRNRQTLRHNSIWTIIEDSHGYLWFGTDGGGVNRLDPATGKFRHFSVFPFSKPVISNNYIYALMEDSEGSIWLGSWGGGVDRIDVESNKCISYKNDPANPNSLSSNVIKCLHQDKEGMIWIGTLDGGLNKFNPATQSFVRYQYDSANKYSISSNDIYSIYEGSDGILWLGTGNGLNSFNKQKELFTRYDKEDGLSNNLIYGVMEDDNNNLWLTSNTGLSKFNTNTKKFKNFDVTEGLQRTGYNIGSYTKLKDGSLAIGGTDGFNIFNPREIMNNPFIPPVVITDLKIFNKSIDIGKELNGRIILDKSITFTDELTLSHGENFFSIEFAALDYTVPGKNQYAYKLENFNEDWIYVNSANRSPNFTNLSGGEYTFMVKASNNDGLWNPEVTRLRITIKPPFFGTAWFKILAIMVIFSMVFGFYFIRTYPIKRKNTELEVINAKLNKEILDRKKAEEEANNEKEKLKVTLRSIGEGVITISIDGTVLLMNPISEDLTGWKQEEAVGRGLHEIFKVKSLVLDDLFSKYSLDTLVNMSESEFDDRAILFTRNGEDKIITHTWAPIKDPSDKTIGFVLIFRDITERENLERELQKTQRLESLGMLAGGLAHDFNNALTAILGNISLAIEPSIPEEKRSVILKRAEKATFQAQNLTQQLLTFSKGGSPMLEATPVEELIRERILFTMAGSKIKCKFNIQNDLQPVDIDKTQICQVLDNLVLNAKESMPSGGTIEISAQNMKTNKFNKYDKKSAEYIQIKVKDHGVGIPESDLDKIFDPFYTTKNAGNGLGLSVSYSIIKKHNGQITVDSQLGKGSVFSIYLPVSKKRITRAKDEQGSKIRKGQGKILMMDDEKDILEVGSEILSFLGYNVVTVKDGSDALKEYKRALNNGGKFDVVILDITIPGGMGGRETIEKLREIDPEINAIISSGYTNDEMLVNYKAFGFKEAVVKPYTIEQLSKAIEDILN